MEFHVRVHPNSDVSLFKSRFLDSEVLSYEHVPGALGNACAIIDVIWSHEGRLRDKDTD